MSPTEEEAKHIKEEQAQEKLEKQLRLDPYFFPAGWFTQSKYSIEERLVRHRGVQEHETIRYRNVRIVWAGVNLAGGESELERGVFNLDGHGQLGFVVPKSHQILWKRYAEGKMPEVVKRPGGVEVLYVDPALKEHTRALKKDWPHLERLDEAWDKMGAEERGENVCLSNQWRF